MVREPRARVSYAQIRLKHKFFLRHEDFLRLTVDCSIVADQDSFGYVCLGASMDMLRSCH